MKTLYITEPGSVVRKSGDCIQITKENTVLSRLPISQIASVLLMGNSHVTAQATAAITRENINIIHANRNGRIYAVTTSFKESRCDLRILQYQAYCDPMTRLAFARAFCETKLASQEQMLRERRALGWKGKHAFDGFFDNLGGCLSISEVLGVEGKAAQAYFSKLAKFSDMRSRSRRPAQDPLNALLNLSYAMVLSPICSSLLAKGFDLQIGFLHSIKNGRPSLALDVLECFRSEVDSFAITITNRKEIRGGDFQHDFENGGYTLTSSAFARFADKFHEHMDLIKPIDQICNRLVLALQQGDAELLLGELEGQ